MIHALGRVGKCAGRARPGPKLLVADTTLDGRTAGWDEIRGSWGPIRRAVHELHRAWAKSILSSNLNPARRIARTISARRCLFLGRGTTIEKYGMTPPIALHDAWNHVHSMSPEEILPTR